MRQASVRRGSTRLPPMCGYIYKTHKSKKYPERKQEITSCTRTAGANTKHQGKGYCDYHEWAAVYAPENNTKQVKDALKVATERAMFFGQMVDTDPHAALLHEINRTASVVEWLHNKMLEFREQGMTDSDIMQQRTLQDGYKPSVWMNLFQTERDHLVKTCVAAIKAGVAEKKVQIAERQGQLIASMMFAFIHDRELGLDTEQVVRAPAIIRKHLLSLPSMSEHEAQIDPEGIMRKHAASTKVVEATAREA